MTPQIRIAALTLAAASAPLAASAHPGDHSGMSLTQGLDHLLTQPDHLGLLAAALLFGVATGAVLLHARRAP